MRYLLLLCLIHGSAIAGPDQPWNEGRGEVGLGAISMIVMAAVAYAIWSDYKRQLFSFIVGAAVGVFGFVALGAVFGSVGEIAAIGLGIYAMIRFYDSITQDNKNKDTNQ